MLNIKFEDIIKYIGHDGSEIWWPELGEPFKRRGFHPQEIIDVCLQIYNCNVTMVQAIPTSVSSNGKVIRIPLNIQARMGYYIGKYNGVLTGQLGNARHAIPWWCKNIDTIKENQADFRIENFFIMH